MKKLEKLNSSLFENFKKNEINGLNRVLGGAIPTCNNNCSDTAETFNSETGKTDGVKTTTTDCPKLTINIGYASAPRSVVATQGRG